MTFSHEFTQTCELVFLIVALTLDGGPYFRVVIFSIAAKVYIWTENFFYHRTQGMGRGGNAYFPRAAYFRDFTIYDYI